MMQRVAALSLALSLAPCTLAQHGDETDLPPESAAFWLSSLRARYHTTPIRELLTITVDGAYERQSEVVEFRSQPLDGFREPEVMIDLGEIEVWTRPPGENESGPGRVRVAHELDARTYWEAPVSERQTTPGVLSEALPPLIVPQVALSLGGQLLPTFGPVTWLSETESRAVGEQPRVELIGRAGTMSVSMTIEADDTPRLERVRLTNEDQGVVITVLGEELTPSFGRLGYDVSRRQRLGDLGALRARPGDLEAGDRLPEMPLVFFSLDDRVPSESYRERMLLFYDGHLLTSEPLPEAALIGLEALRRAEESVGPSARIDPIGVLDPLRVGDQIQTMELAMMNAVEPNMSWYSVSDKHTRRRFSADASSVIVIASKTGWIAGVIPLDALEERAAEEGRDALVGAIASEVVELCGAIRRRERAGPPSPDRP